MNDFRRAFTRTGAPHDYGKNWCAAICSVIVIMWSIIVWFVIVPVEMSFSEIQKLKHVDKQDQSEITDPKEQSDQEKQGDHEEQRLHFPPLDPKEQSDQEKQGDHEEQRLHFPPLLLPPGILPGSGVPHF